VLAREGEWSEEKLGDEARGGGAIKDAGDGQHAEVKSLITFFSSSPTVSTTEK